MALEVLRSQRSGVRSALVDSVWPPFVDGGVAKDIANADRVTRVYYDACANDPPCAQRFPTLEADVSTVAHQLDSHPYPVSYTDPSGVVHQLHITGQDVVLALYMALYDSTIAQSIPLYVEQFKNGDYSFLNLAVQVFIPQFAAGISWADWLTVQCADPSRTSKSVNVAALRRSHPLYGRLITAPFVPDICADWNVTPVTAAFNQVRPTRIPTLVFVDKYDPVTPPADARETAKRLGPRATFIEFPGLGHGATANDPCPVKIYHAFLDNPTTVVDNTCVAHQGTLTWWGIP